MHTRVRFLILFLLGASLAVRGATPRLEDAFAHPPREARPWVYWFWSDGNITRAGITADLEAMQRVGIGGVLIMEVDQGVPKGPVRFMTPAWREMFAFAVAEAGRLGLEVNMNNDAGWNGSGGPWNDAAHSMQKVVWQETRARGPGMFDAALPQPEVVEGFYRDIAVLAFPTPAAERRGLRELAPKLAASDGRAFGGEAMIDGDAKTGALLPAATKRGERPSVTLEFSEPFTARSLDLALTLPTGQRVLCELQASDDGRQFRGVTRYQAGAAPKTFAPVRARFFRLVFNGPAAALAKLQVNEIGLTAGVRIEDFVAKSGMKLGSSAVEVAPVPAEAAVDRRQLVDLTARTHEGRLRWEIPAGDWTIVRLGHTSTGRTNHPSPLEGRGLEVDKLSRAAIDHHFDAFMGTLIRDSGRTGTGVLTTVHIDSWEVGYQNWTPDFRAAFKQRRGYDPLPWLPALAGRVVEDAAASERFLWDMRRTISELLNDNYAGEMAELAHRQGRTFSLEGYSNGPFDCLSYTGRADLPIAEFWTTPDPATLHASVKTMTSAAHIYGRKVVAAEAFTATDLNGRQQHHPFSIKAIGDAAFCGGINQFIFHRYSLQPWTDDRKPGMTMGPWGLEYERTATWWEQSRPWHEYLARCQYLLRQGLYVADLCYLQSEEGINNPMPIANVTPPPPEGYSFDFCSDEVVRTRMSVRDGRLVLPDGMSYRVLVMPAQRLMTSALLRRLRDFVRAGATILGAPPLRSPSLANQPAADAEVKQLVAEMWADLDGATRTERTLGRGHVAWGPTPGALLAKLGASPDFMYRPTPAGSPKPLVRFIHRTLPDREMYFVANLGEAATNVTASFRVDGRVPELWRADRGTIEPVAVYDAADGRVRIPLALEPRGSVFVVFRATRQPLPENRVVALRRDGTTLLESGPVAPPEEPAPGTAERTATRDVSRTFTMAAWVKPEAPTALPAEDFGGIGGYSVNRNDVIFPPPGHEVYRRNTEAGAGFAVGTNGVAVFEHGDSHFPATLVQRTPIQGWTHVAIVVEDGQPTLYLNGKRVRTGLKTTMTVHGGVGVVHGRAITPFKGEHSNVEQFDRALSAGEIAALMQKTPPVAAAPVAAKKPKSAPLPVAELPKVRIAANGAVEVTTTEPGRYEAVLASGRVLSGVVGAADRLTVSGPWTLGFPPGWGAPPEVQLPELRSWSEHAVPGVKYFSGTVTYRRSLDVPVGFAASNRRVELDLGTVDVIADVRLNGRELGILWKPPFRIDVTDALKPGQNELEIKVTNLWINRLIGDEQLPPDREWTAVARRRGAALKAYPDWFLRGERSPVGRVTFATWKHYDKDAPLLPSGLLGPVMLCATSPVALDPRP